MNFSISSIFAGIIFSGIGLYAFRRGKRDSNFQVLIIGIVLMSYTFFTNNPYLDWGIGAALSAYLFSLS